VGEYAYAVVYNPPLGLRKSENLLSSWVPLLLEGENYPQGWSRELQTETWCGCTGPIICLALGGRPWKVQFSSKDLLQQLVTFLETGDASSVGSVQVALCTLE